MKLNLSQTEIAMTEQVSPESARNIISLKLFLPDHAQDVVKEAADRVLDSADIFTAHLCRRENIWEMEYSERNISESRIWGKQTLEQAEEHMEQSDRLPMDFDGCLYQSEVIPLTDGGCVLYVRFHHIIIDGYSMSLFVQKVLDVLAGKAISRSVFAESGGCEQDRNEKECDFWHSYFSEAEFEPSVFPQKAVGVKCSSYRVGLSDDMANVVKTFSEREDVTVPYVFAAAYAYYLAEATGRNDAVFLMPRLNRTKEQMNTLGCYTLLVPVRVKIRQSDTFGELCAAVREASREASLNKRIGFDRILSALREDDILSETLSEYVLNYYRFPYSSDLRYRVRYSVAGAMNNHMTWNIFRNEKDGFDFQMDYHESVYTEEKAKYFCDAVCSILLEGTRNKKLSDIKIVGEAEYKKITSIQGKGIEIGKDLTIPSLFRRAAGQYGSRTAVYAGERALTFGELDEISDRIACALIRHGVKSGDYVAFMLRRDWRLIPAILGISKTGAAFIPVDPDYPADRISYIMENSEAACLVSSADTATDDGSIENRGYFDIDELLTQETEKELLPEIRQEQPAYMIYTSGTTGRPKGVMLSHRGIANIVHPDNNPFNRDITKNCKGIVAIGSVCFDISLFEIFVPLMNGLFVELGNEKAMLDAGELAIHILRHGADILHCTPSRIMAYLGNRAFAEALSHIKAVLAAGEVLQGSLVKQLKNTYGIRTYNGYGPTETTIGATITEAGDDETIGEPIANTGIVLLNRERRIVPFGAVGEVCIYGAGVGIGYKDRPEETRSKYILWNNTRLYRTGDFGYFSEDGRLIYRGRNDRQVKLRGLRIEISEIEKVLEEFPGVAACNCIIRKVEKTDHLVGFYIAESGKTVEPELLKNYMKSKLALYMVPDILKELPSMPQTPNGKTDVKALAMEEIEYNRIYRKPITHREEMVCCVFAETLGMEKVGLDDNFFELGGDSLSAVTAMLGVENKLGLPENQLEFGDLYKYPTPSLLLNKLYGNTEEDTGFDLAALDYHEIDEYLAAHTEAEVKTKHLGNVLLTGVTGYLGIHILLDLLRRPDLCGKIICLSRSKKNISAEKRVKSALFYYDETDFSQSYGEKWVVAEGDITNPDIFTEPLNIPVDTVINSAANVSHFSYGSALEETNTDGVRNLIRYAQKKNALLCQISTISVSGITQNGAQKACFTEKDFYIGQEIHNQYIYSKYMAEYEMLRAAADEGLKIKLMRVGNLQGRIRDGEFQMNIHSNAFTRQFSSYIKIGTAPQSVYEGSVNFSPVDEVAHHIVSLTATGTESVVFHVYPSEEVKFAELFAGCGRLGRSISVVPDTEFHALMQKLKQTEEGKKQAEGLFTRELEGKYHEIPVSQEITERYIRELSGGWSGVTEEYLNQYLSALDGMNLF